MELAPSTEPWTVTVAWAQPWRHPAAASRSGRANKSRRRGRWRTLAAVPFIAGSALSAETEMTYRVNGADLNLQTADGVVALYSRLEVAAGAVCDLAQARGYAERQRARRCIAVTLAAEIRELGPDLGPALRAAAMADRTIPAPGWEKGHQAEL